MTIVGPIAGPTAERPAEAPAGPDRRVLGSAALLLLGGAFYLDQAVAGRQALLYLLGAALGLVLYHAAFGFTAAWRVFLAQGRGAGLRAQMVMLALASVIFLPAIEAGSLFGQPVGGGAVAPLGVSVVIGAFLFGIGMQLGGGCASGTLYSVGGGAPRMVVTLFFFIVGSLLGSLHMPWWVALPSHEPVALGRALGLGGALALQLGLFAGIAAVTLVVERRRHGRPDPGSACAGGPQPVTRRPLARLLQGPWPLLAGAVLLALLNGATLALAGHPWSVTFGLTLWGASAAQALGLDVASWTFWTWPYPSRALAAGVLADSTSIMNFGLIAGAFLAAGLAGRFGPWRRIGWRPALAAVLGGLLMGYGARLAYGCNIGAYFSGIASGSLHGWLWFAAALAGSWLGTALRPRFGLAVEGRGAGHVQAAP